MRGENILFERNDFQCKCSLFNSTKLTIALSREPSVDPNSRTMNSQRTRDQQRREQKLSLSELKNHRQKSKGFREKKSPQNPEQLKKPIHPKYNIEYDSYRAYQNAYSSTQIPKQAIIPPKPRQKTGTQLECTRQNFSYLDHQKYSSSHLPVSNISAARNYPSNITSSNQIEVLPLPSYPSNIKSHQAHSSVKKKTLYTESTYQNTLCSTKEPILSTQSSNYQFVTKFEELQNQNQRAPTPSSSLTSRGTSKQRQKAFLRQFKDIESINCSESDSRSEVLSFEGFWPTKTKPQSQAGRQSKEVSMKRQAEVQTSLHKKFRSNISSAYLIKNN